MFSLIDSSFKLDEIHISNFKENPSHQARSPYNSLPTPIKKLQPSLHRLDCNPVNLIRIKQPHTHPNVHHVHGADVRHGYSPRDHHAGQLHVRSSRRGYGHDLHESCSSFSLASLVVIAFPVLIYPISARCKGFTENFFK